MVLTKNMSENDLLTFVMDAAERGGWVRTHFRPAKTAKGWRTPVQGEVGFPDCVFVHAKLKRCVFVELKAQRGALRPEQKTWIEALLEVPGVETYVWRPSDMAEIKEVLLGHRIRKANSAPSWG